MKFFTFAITYPFIWLLSRLPMGILYLFSDFFFFVLYHILGYRKKTIIGNLNTAFPNKKRKEINKLSRKFSRHFVDLIFESIKSFTISEKEILKRYKYKNPELINELTKQGKSIALVGAHQANWEWAFAMPKFLDINCYGAYTKIQNPYFEKKIKTSRTKFGFEGVPTIEFNKTISSREAKKIQTLYILLSDQSPKVRKTRYWSHFLNKKVPVHTGAEILAKKYDLTVVNMNTTKIKRGYFETEFELITDNPKSFDNFEITDKFLEITERNINKQPECYLWSHKRFKHKDKYDEWLKIRKTSQK
ncbi:lysophospholipid acyltransferase family protein [Tenacibaculum sp. HL-MS23]|uniref:lysophospholipid acyltransferase family protein n=1 Tax=Tenacibaculum TaxID=104267 RepID=UPI001C4EF700|nr:MULTISPECIES: lysophospholipid acyltransferase family protein [Tenacibaculum]QXP74753.1 lysophospholipid acyltransferase family protein [Tenacibaculum sp. AHE14PA]QXP76264.1 lysophospholipid acyltransferase family protein [Tenacibaculum sp. AHE15PA]WNW02796.1 lysophospholipid acyltransferase family protein [Tenacibaculum sp. HL-MS23]